jgi:hypothetical protein
VKQKFTAEIGANDYASDAPSEIKKSKESYTSGRAGGLKNVNRSKRIVNFHHLKVSVTESHANLTSNTKREVVWSVRINHNGLKCADF